MQEQQPSRRNDVFEAPNAREQVTPSAGAVTFDVPDHEVPLPSCGKVYPEGSALHDAKMVWISAMTTAQENILTNKSLVKKGTIITHLIQSCLKDRSIVAKDMLSGDRNTLMVALRISGYGSEYKGDVSCSKCGEISPQTFALDKFPIKQLAIDPVSPGTNVFEFRLPQSKAVVHFKFLTGADEEDIAAQQTQRKKLGLADSELVTTGLLASIISINGNKDKSVLGAAIPKMPARDSQALRAYIQENEPHIDMKGSVICSHCDHSEEVEMPWGASFFWPNAR